MYIEISKIQQKLTEHYETYHHCATIPQVVGELAQFSENILDTDINPFPENAGQLPDEEFMECFMESRFPLLSFMKSVDQGNWREAALFTPRQFLQIFRHLNYTDQGIHSHNYFEIVYVFKGTCTMSFGHDLVQMETGDVCIIAPGSMHEIHPLDPQAFILNICLARQGFESAFLPVMINGNLIAAYIQTILYQEGMDNYLYISASDSDKVKMFIKCAAYESRDTGAYADSRAISWISLFFSTIFQEFPHSVHMHQYMNSSVQADYIALIQYIQKHYLTVTLDSAAAHFHYNKTYLSRLIRKLMGKSFMEVVVELRMKKAADYLLATQLEVSQIAELCGYDDPNYFTKIFKRYYHTTPSGYRKGM